MATTIMVSPASGDTSASLFTSADATSTILESVESGTMLKVISTSGGFHQVAYTTPDAPSKGGTEMSGCICASPYCTSYETEKKKIAKGNFNNGTVIKIIDDTTDERMFKVSGITTDGLQTVWVDQKYIYRDTVQEEVVEEDDVAQISPFSISPMTASTFSISTMSLTDGGTETGTVTPSSGLNYRSGPSVTSTNKLGAWVYGTEVTISESSGGWYKITAVNGTTLDTAVWASATYISISSTNTTASISTSDTVTVDSDSASTSTSTTSSAVTAYYNNFGNISYDSTQGLDNDEYYSDLTTKYSYSLGNPPKYNMDIDPQYVNENFAGVGRIYQKTFLANATYLSLCPGTVVMFPDLIGTERSGIVEALMDSSGGVAAILEKIAADENGSLSSQMYSFSANLTDYGNYLNTLCRSCAIMLELQDETVPSNGASLATFDYTYWALRKKYNASSALSADPGVGIFTNFWGGGIVGTVTDIVNTAVTDDSYINFFLNATETSVSESISTTVSDGPLSDVFDTISDLGAKINYFTGSGFNLATDDVSAYLDAALSTGDTIESMAQYATNILKGGRMVLPKMISDASYGKSMTFHFKFVSLYGDKKAVFFRCIVPTCHLLAMALPKQISDNMYTFPFVVRGGQLGSVNFDLAVITGIEVTRGGSDDTSWTLDTLATEWDVRVEITPLIDDLMITSVKNPVLFLKNEGLLDYLSNMCGFDMLACNLETKLEFFKAGILSTVYDIPANIELKITDAVYNKLHSIFNFGV